MSEAPNEILVDRAIIRSYMVLDKIKKLITRAHESSLQRTTVSLTTLEDLITDLGFLYETLHQIKY